MYWTSRKWGLTPGMNKDMSSPLQLDQLWSPSRLLPVDSGILTPRSTKLTSYLHLVKEVKNTCSYIFCPSHIFRMQCFIQHRDNTITCVLAIVTNYMKP